MNVKTNDFLCKLSNCNLHNLFYTFLQFVWLNGERYDRFSEESKTNPVYKYALNKKRLLIY